MCRYIKSARFNLKNTGGTVTRTLSLRALITSKNSAASWDLDRRIQSGNNRLELV